MKTHAAHPLVCATLALLIGDGPSRLEAQVSATRGAAPPTVPVVTRPAEGQVVAGDLEIAIAAPAGVGARKYTTEASYWDAARGRWVYPGTLGAEFGGSAAATTRIAADTRARHSAAATRWRIRVRATDPPGGWGPWREFSWQAVPGQPGSARATVAPAPGAVTNPPVATAAPPSGVKAQDAAALLAQLDSAITFAKQQIVLLNLKIIEENEKIDSLHADILETEALLKETQKQGMTPDTLKYITTVVGLKTHIEDDLKAIHAAEQHIDSYKEQIKVVEKEIIVLQKQKEALLARL